MASARVRPAGTREAASPRLGVRANAGQIGLLMLVNALVGGMVGLERTLVPLIGTQEFGLVRNALVAGFVVSFGLAKAAVNLGSGALADRYGRRRVLILGWAAGLPVPWLIMWAPAWEWIVAANVLLGINQGLAWSMTLVMKMDLVAPRRRGLVAGLNEFAGYFALGVTALATGYLASAYGLRPHPFVLGIAYSVAGLLLSWTLVRDTFGHLGLERHDAPPETFRRIFARTTWREPALRGACQAGLVNNLNDGMAWVILPLFLAAKGIRVDGIGLVKFVYPVAWAVCQLITGPLSDRYPRVWLIGLGMATQAAAIWLIVLVGSAAGWLAASALLGVGTALVYPTLLAAVADSAAPAWRAQALGVYRFWRDIGYAVGALLAGVLADLSGYPLAIAIVGALTLLSGAAAVTLMRPRSGRRIAPPEAGERTR